jgi:hypothetical protein
VSRPSRSLRRGKCDAIPERSRATSWRAAGEPASTARLSRLFRGVFNSVAELDATIANYLTNHNAKPTPFVWTKSADVILAKVGRARATLAAVKTGNQPLESVLEEMIAKNVSEFAFIMQPMKMQGATGSTVAPIAVR